MRKILCTPLTLALLFTGGIPQTPSSDVVLDVKASGFKIEPVGEHIYLRVYADGHVAFDDYKPSIKGFYLNEAQISQDQLASLENQLRDLSKDKIATSYQLKSPLNPIVQHVKITIAQPNGFQTLEISAVATSDAKRSDPRTLTGLICSIEKLRNGARFRLIDLHRCRG